MRTTSFPRAGGMSEPLRRRSLILAFGTLTYPKMRDGQRKRNGHGMMHGGSSDAGYGGRLTRPAESGGGGSDWRQFNIQLNSSQAAQRR